MYYTERPYVVGFSSIKRASNKIDLIKKIKWYYFDFWIIIGYRSVMTSLSKTTFIGFE
jgi:hypothetical protein